MKLISIALIIFYSQSGLAVQTIKLNSIGPGKLLHIDGNIQLPKGQKLNKAAPSKIEIYEKNEKGWELTDSVNLNDIFTLSELIDFQKPIKLKSDKSEIKLEASLYHCPKAGRGICVIDDYEGLIKRNPKKASSEVRLSLFGSTPK